MEYYEDITVGERLRFGEWEMTRAEIIAFAEQWDPQRFHVDEAAAAESVHGGIIASGIHTIAAANRLCVDAYMGDIASLGGRYISEVRFEQPVRPGDTLVIYGEVLDKETPDHTDSHGYLDFELSAEVDGEVVLAMLINLVVGREV